MPRTVDLQKNIVSGPDHSMRFGRFLGVNLLPTLYKLCPFNCVHCDFDSLSIYPLDVKEYQNDLPAVQEVVEALRNALLTQKNIDYITISGNGEPTVHPDFSQIIDSVTALCDEMAPSVDVCVISNGVYLLNKKILNAFDKVDVPIFKLEAGTEALFKKIYRPMSGVSLEAIVSGLEKIQRFYLQSTFFDGLTSNTGSKNLNAYCDIVGRIRPVSVQLFTLDQSFQKGRVKPVGREKLEEIGHQIELKTGVPYCVYGALTGPG